MKRLWARGVPVLSIAIALAACQEKKQPPVEQAKPKPKRYVVPEALDRELNENELDSLQQMKATHHVTRDEYWDGYGGVFENDHFEVWYPDGKVNSLQGMAMLKLADEARERTLEVFGKAPGERAVIICAGDIDVYMYVTGRQWWQYSRIVGDTISIQPPINLYTRGLLPVVGPREYYEWAIGKLASGRAPRWVEEGLSSHLAGETALLEDMRQDFADRPLVMSTQEMESALERETDRQETRRAYYNAYRMVAEIVRTRGQEAMAKFVVALGETDQVDAAAQTAFGADFGDVVEAARAWAKND